jgi:hypothetical protein
VLLPVLEWTTNGYNNLLSIYLVSHLNAEQPEKQYTTSLITFTQMVLTGNQNINGWSARYNGSTAKKVTDGPIGQPVDQLEKKSGWS